MNEDLPKKSNEGKLNIHITEKTDKIEKIPGIKLPYYEHQKVLIKQMINLIQNGVINYQGNKIQTKNIWLKGSIGTGKSLCLLSLIQYFKNNQYKGLISQVPIKMGLLDMIKQSDKFFSQQPFTGEGLYEQLHHINFYNFDIAKIQGYVINGQGKYIKYKSFRKQSIIFVQQQVYDQFIDYIKEQTSLSYFGLTNSKDLFNFIFDDKEAIESDIILWNIDQINIQGIFIMLIQNIKQYADKNKLTQSQLIDKQNYIEKHYKDIDNFNDFWIKYQELHQYKPFVFACYDDFDMIQLTTSYPIDSLYNIFVGSTMIQRVNQYINVCSNFILNKHINYLTGFRVDEQQLQKILSLPPNHIHNIICATPSRIYMQFKMLAYLRDVFDMIVKTEQNIHVDCIVFNDQVFNDLLLNKITFNKLFFELKKYKLVFKDLPYSQGFILDLINNIKMICFGQYIINSGKYNQEQLDKIIQNTINPYIYQNNDSVFTKQLYACKKYDEIVNKMMEMSFKINPQEINKYKLTCPFSTNKNYQILSPDCYITRCCSQPFNKEHKNEVIYYDQGQKYCAFCQRQIDDIERYLLDIKTQRFIHDKNIVQTNKFKQEIYQVDYSGKLQELYKIIKNSFIQKKKIMIISNQFTLQNNIVQQLYEPEEPKEYTVQSVKDYTREINLYILGDIQVNYGANHKEHCIQYIRSLISRGKVKIDQGQQLIQQILKDDFAEERIADIIQVHSLHQIIGANMTYIDQFIFFDVPEQAEEILQIIGRSRRIGRKFEQDIDSYFMYYPLQQIVKIQ